MNVNDSEKMAWLLWPEYILTEDYEKADLIIVNTCSVREKPQHKVYSEAGRYKALKKKNPKLIIGITGCVAQQEGEKLLEKLPYVDFVLGTQSFFKVKEVVKQIEEKREKIVLTELKEDFEFPFVAPVPEVFLRIEARVSGFVTVMQGCDNFCTYCIVPFVRGREISRPPEDILREVEFLAQSGVKEVVLLGQNVNSYGLKNPDYPSFARLIELVSKVEGIERIRFTTSHPKDLSDELIEVIAENPKVCKHIHLPLQAGSNRILKLMNRKYTKEDYLRKVEKLKRAVPGIALTTDIIVGFPGETEEEFLETVEVLKEVRYHEIYSFKYSDRPFTAASKMEAKIPEEEKARRLEYLQSIQKKITQEVYQEYLGKAEEVLVEGLSKKNPNEFKGRTSTNVVVNIELSEGAKSLNLCGKLVKVKITEAGKHSLKGILLSIIKN